MTAHEDVKLGALGSNAGLGVIGRDECEAGIVQRLLCWLFALIYRRWLFDDWTGKQARVVKVRGWRTALIDSSRGRSTMTPCFWWFE